MSSSFALASISATLTYSQLRATGASRGGRPGLAVRCLALVVQVRLVAHCEGKEERKLERGRRRQREAWRRARRRGSGGAGGGPPSTKTTSLPRCARTSAIHRFVDSNDARLVMSKTTTATCESRI